MGNFFNPNNWSKDIATVQPFLAACSRCSHCIERAKNRATERGGLGKAAIPSPLSCFTQVPWLRASTWYFFQADGGGTVVYRLQVSDKDEGSNKILTYAMISGHNGQFILNSNTGVLQISPTGLDRELHSSYNITINVTDGGQPTLWVSIILKRHLH